jgi:2'-5' RNA ligase
MGRLAPTNTKLLIIAQRNAPLALLLHLPAPRSIPSMKSAPPLRLFVAIYPPQGWVDAALKCLPLDELPSGRATLGEQLHLTLAFLGDRLERELPALIESIQAAASGLKPFDISTTGLCLLPEDGPARLIAANLTAPPQLHELQRRLARRLVKRRRETDFIPHISLYRFGAATAGGQLDEDDDASPAEGDGSAFRERVRALLPPVYLQTFRVSELAVVASVLHPLGVRHRIVERVPFSPPS